MGSRSGAKKRQRNTVNERKPVKLCWRRKDASTEPRSAGETINPMDDFRGKGSTARWPAKVPISFCGNSQVSSRLTIICEVPADFQWFVDGAHPPDALRGPVFALSRRAPQNGC